MLFCEKRVRQFKICKMCTTRSQQARNSMKVSLVRSIGGGGGGGGSLYTSTGQKQI